MRSILLKITLLLTGTLAVISGAPVAPALPAIADEFSHIPNVDLFTKLVLTLPALSIAIFGPVFGILVDRLGRIPMLKVALFIYSIAGVAAFYLNGLVLILLSRFCLGLSVAVIITIGITLVGDYFKGEERENFSSMLAVSLSVSSVVFVLLGGFLSDIGWRYTFLMYSIASVVFLLAVFVLYEPGRSEEDIQEELTTPYPTNTVVVVLLTIFISMIMFYMIPVQMPFLIRDLGVQSGAAIGIALAGFTIGSTISAGFHAKLKRAVGFSKVYAIAFSIIFFGFLLISISATYVFVIAALFISGLGTGYTLPNSSLWLLEVVPYRRRAMTMGILSSCIFSGQFVSPIVLEPIIIQTGLGGAFVVTGIFSGLMGVYFYLRKSIS